METTINGVSQDASSTELAKVPKSDSTVTWNATALASVNAEVDTALNTIVPASPTAGSLNDALSKAAGGNTYNKTTDSLEALSDKVALEASITAGFTAGAKAAAASETRLAELDAANLPADIDTIKGLVDSAETTGPYSYTDAGGEQDVVADTAVTRRRIWVEFSNRNMTLAGTFRLYRKVDGTNYDLYITQGALVAASSDRAFDAEFTTNQAWKLTYQESADEAAARAIPFNIVTEVIE